MLDKVRASLRLGKLTQDVNHVLDAITYLGQSMCTDLNNANIDETKTDYQLTKELDLSRFDLLRDFASMPTLFPKQKFSV